AWVAVHSSSLAAFMSPAWDGSVIWTPPPVAELLPPGQSLAALSAAALLPGAARVVVAVLLSGGLGGYGGEVVARRRRKADADEEDADAIMLGGVAIARIREVAHFLIAGATGTGKSVLITLILWVVQQRRQRAIV